MQPDVHTALVLLLAGFAPLAVAALAMVLIRLTSARRRTTRRGGRALRPVPPEPANLRPRAAVRCPRCHQLVAYEHHPEGRDDALRLHYYDCGTRWRKNP